ncbi:MAG: cysteine desulfurase [Candidatus Melainabacteria bacterium]
MTMTLSKSHETPSLSDADVQRIRADFPMLSQVIHGRPLVYLDNGATTLKPAVMIEAVRRFYAEEYGTVRRGLYQLSAAATAAFDDTRQKVADWIHAPGPETIIFTRGATEAINLVASSWGRANLMSGDEILITAMEHHANIVPWQLIAEQTGAVVKVIPITDAGELAPGAADALLNERTKMLAITHVSNVLGTVNPIAELVQKAHAVGAVTLVDGAQAAAHLRVDVQALNCDFYAFSAHKTMGPTGLGVLYGKTALLEAMPPYQGGGDMIATVSFEGSTFAPPPKKFEAGTPAIAEVIGFGASLDYLNGIGLDAIAAYEHDLLHYATEQLLTVPGLTIYGTAADKASLISFTLEAAHASDIGTLIDHEGIAIRTGHHCAQPLMDRFGVSATARASFAFYNTRTEIASLVGALQKVIEMCS